MSQILSVFSWEVEADGVNKIDNLISGLQEEVDQLENREDLDEEERKLLLSRIKGFIGAIQIKVGEIINDIDVRIEACEQTILDLGS